MVENNHLGVVLLNRSLDFLRLAVPDKQTRFRPGARGRHCGNGIRSCGFNKFSEFLKILTARANGEIHMDQYGPLSSFRALEQTATPSQ